MAEIEEALKTVATIPESFPIEDLQINFDDYNFKMIKGRASKAKSFTSQSIKRLSLEVLPTKCDRKLAQSSVMSDLLTTSA